MPYRQFCSPFVLGKARGEVGKANRSVVDENLFALRAKKCLREGEKSEQKRRRRRFVRIARQKNACGKVENANRRVTEEELFASLAGDCPLGRKKCEQKSCRERYVRIANSRSPAERRKMRTEQRHRKSCSHCGPGNAEKDVEGGGVAGYRVMNLDQ